MIMIMIIIIICTGERGHGDGGPRVRGPLLPRNDNDNHNNNIIVMNNDKNK